jgi:hypothetical protein
MSDIPSSSVAIQAEGVQSTRPVSESAMFAIGGAVNYAILNTGKIGDIVSLMLTESAFQSLRDTTWILCDGRSILGSDLANLAGTNYAPDMRGVYPRGCDNGRGLDPHGSQNPGTYVADQFASHSHAVNDPQHAHSISGLYQSGGSGTIEASGGFNPPAANWHTDAAATGITLGASGGTETAPKTVYVNFFIKINT